MQSLALAFLIMVAGAWEAVENPASQYPRGAPALQLEWRVGGLSNPESVALSADGQFLYVSNVNGEGDAVDGNGFISRVRLDGEVIERKWAVGLNGPKGLVRVGDLLYVSDINRVVAIDTATGATRSATPIPAAVFLNDIAVLPDGGILVADSGRSRIHLIAGATVSVWLEDPLLTRVNGLFVEPTRLVATTMAGRLLEIDHTTRTITVLTEGLGQGDGVAALAEGRYLVSHWPGLLHLVDADGGSIAVMDTQGERRFINDFLLVGDMLFVPHWEPGELSAFRLNLTTEGLLGNVSSR